MKKAKKSLSQNFIKDKNICRKILKGTSINNQNIVEIGPGYGFLTDIILEQNPNSIHIIEKDNEIYDYLKIKYLHNKNVFIVNDDALDFDFSKFRNIKVISNLPYNVSTKIILKLFYYSIYISEMIFMIQKEVALKFDYNIEKINKYKFLTKIYSNYERKFNVPPSVFKPKPKVESTVVSFKINKNNYDYNNLIKFSNLIFKNKRKKISNNFLIKDKKISIFLDKRVDELEYDDILKIYNFF